MRMRVRVSVRGRGTSGVSCQAQRPSLSPPAKLPLTNHEVGDGCKDADLGEEVGQLHQGGRVDVHEGAVHAGCPLTVQHLQGVLHNGARSSGSGRWGLMQWPGDDAGS